MIRFFLAVCHWGVGLALVFPAAEAMARLDDWIHYRTPIDHNVDRERDLTTVDAFGLHGRPHGRFRDFRLNRFGFRGPEITEAPDATRMRIMLLGASETFGLVESRDKEYPAQLAVKLADRSRYEIINAAVPGMTLRMIRHYWIHWASRFKPEWVLIYPTPLFYLDNEPPVAPEFSINVFRERFAIPPRFGLRIKQRATDTIRTIAPAYVRTFRANRSIQASLAASKAPIFQEIPQERMTLYIQDLRLLGEEIEKCNARPIFLTHANRAGANPDDYDKRLANQMRMFFPRATVGTMLAFERESNERLRALCAQQNWAVIDMDKSFSGDKPSFSDFTHFNDQGAGKFADILAESLRKEIHAIPARRP